ncbi:MAG: sialate O-acetylesterase, partial [Sphingobacteriales bacterium]
YKVGEAFSSRPAPGFFSAQNAPTALYNAMVAPAIGYAIKGVLWYQGESNTSNPVAYSKLMPALIDDWRTRWQNKSLPFLYVQLPGFMDVKYLPGESDWAATREAQLSALRLPFTAMVVGIDLGEWNDIHPDNKKDVGERLALTAMNRAYGDTAIVYSGPLFRSQEISEGKITLHFSHIGSGLVTRDGDAPGEFAIAGADKKFIWARTQIKDNKVIAWHESIKEPLYIRYAWADNPDNPNLYNLEGLPASPFRTDQP